MPKKIDRRTFIGTVGAAAGTLVLGDPLGRHLAHAAGGNVYSAHDAGMSSGTSVDEARVRAALDACVKAMSGKSSVGAAWESVFAGVTASKKIAIKINCLRKEVSPQLATIKALVGGLTQMCGGTFPADNILLFDNTMEFTGLSGSERMAAVYGASNLSALGLTYSDPSTQYADETFSVKGQSYHPATYLAQADYGIDLAPLKRHQYYGGGLTGVIKNMMGACSTSTSSYAGGSRFHDGAPFQPFVDLFKNYMRDKLQLYLLDMVFAADTENAAGWSKAVNRITIATDPCAADAYAASVLGDLGINATDAVPKALANAGLGTASFTLVEPGPSSGGPTRDELDARIRAHREGGASEAEVRALIKDYRTP